MEKKLSKKVMALERYNEVRSYYLRHKKDFQIDDITWNDLDMDDIYHAMGRDSIALPHVEMACEIESKMPENQKRRKVFVQPYPWLCREQHLRGLCP